MVPQVIQTRYLVPGVPLRRIGNPPQQVSLRSVVPVYVYYVIVKLIKRSLKNHLQ